MPNYLITNKQGSILALAPLLDVAGNALVLQPKGAKGDEKEIDAETAADEIVERVRAAGWASVRLLAANPQQATPRAPTPPPLPPPPPAPEPKVETPPPPPPPAPEPQPEAPLAPIETTLPTETTTSSETPTPPAKVKRDRK